MPVFGKGRSDQPARRRALRLFVGKEAFQKRGSRKVRYRPYEKYSVEKASLSDVSERLLGLFSSDGFIDRRFVQTKKPVVVLDWGCGRARAIEELAIRFRDCVKAYGYSKDSYKDWKTIDHAKLILNTPERLLRYFKPESVDLIYSHYGLYHYPDPAYVEKLATRLKKGGALVFDVRDSIDLNTIQNHLTQQLPSEYQIQVHPKQKVVWVQRKDSH